MSIDPPNRTVDPQEPASPKRRRVLIAGSAALAAAAVGGIWIGSRLDGREAWIESVVRANLPGYHLDQASLTKFVRSFVHHREFEDRKSEIAVWMAQATPALAERISKAARRVERIERMVMTEYLVGSNFFREPNPREATIIYSGPLPACGNPFAVFRAD